MLIAAIPPREKNMQQYSITGMSCAACSARVEKAVSKLPGVSSCAVSLLTNSMGVEGSASPAEIIAAVEGAGYGAKLKGGERSASASMSEADSALIDRETPKLKKRLIASVILLLILMYFSMGHMMWSWPLPKWFDNNHVAMGLVQLVLSALIMVINQRFFTSGFKALWNRSPNMDTLVALGSTASFVWSLYALFMMTRAQTDGDMMLVEHYMMEFYFESAAMIVTLITVGKMLEARSKGKTTDALKGLMKLAPKSAVIVENGIEKTVPIEAVKKGDIFVVRPGESIPVDGVVIDGISAVNEASLTGESIPVDKQAGSPVSAATINESGFLTCEATRVGEDTTLSQIIKMVSDAAATKAPIAKIADKVSGIFVPVVIVIAVITFIVWLALGKEFSYALARGISVLVISCPCALGLATPVAIMVGSGMGAKNGILFKTAVSLEEAGKAQIVALDKTGTVTSGEPRVTDIIPAGGISEKELISLAYSLESRSEHPLARAIVARAEENSVSALEVSDFAALPGNGLEGRIGANLLRGGSMNYIGSVAKVGGEMLERAQALAAEGKTPLLFARDNDFLGIIAVADVIKPESPQAIAELQNMGIRVVMLTGDNERTARAIGAQAGVDHVIAGVLPEGKERVIRRLAERGKVVMVGDGINDAPALTRADMGFAIGAGTDVAIDAADVVLMKSKLSDVPAAIRLSRATLRNIHENLFWAFIYNIIGIPLAAGVFIPIFGWTLNPMFGAAAMSLSSFCVVTNALRLNLFKVHSAKRDKMRTPVELDKAFIESILDLPACPLEGTECGVEASDGNAVEPAVEQPESAAKTLTVHIEGMMCEHCERSVKAALEALPFVASAEASHEKGVAVVVLSGEADEGAIKSAIESEDYEFISIE